MQYLRVTNFFIGFAHGDIKVGTPPVGTFVCVLPPLLLPVLILTQSVS
ncbi:hypothetical protein BofuT4_uP084830.1 [Botrytis cinerea T4]|uniref:Uncharacterized protein n=1 Tax=Botryotinia fuckeliana (strain T4) TaxID=999810 RepID=G2YJP2_BOTF4|nr:hypothetical protein BofuT4_uP084830.1 [Botrytis cinerea T4]